MSMPRKSLFLFAIAILVSTGGMALLEPWIIRENIDNAGMSNQQLFGYIIIAAVALLNIYVAILFGQKRGWKFVNANFARKISTVAAGLVVATMLTLVSYTISSAIAQLLAQS